MSANLLKYVAGLNTLRKLMERFDATADQVRYAIKKARVTAMARIGSADVFRKEDVAKIGNALKRKKR